ncbi:hypothetical protein AZI86_07025 [Bdellovibrio bacteriovorus]|uniref:DUF333 domain-containing protein n=1 Tax=Bdellovibrio bacteriovorus TaxID=959 RepID=A0A150WQY4_BDEBC|nr:DUF333 domain-containing protein [Bdellovibrio bacteriovorus]KYG66786.1 hypothetical protein AZI86_07025 [Bdellovibrio bacteriovorus]
MKENFYMNIRNIALIGLLLTLSNPVLAKDIILKRYIPAKKASIEVKAVSFKGFRISKNCGGKEPMTCMAWKSTSIKIQNRTSASVPLVGHPAARNCQDLQGVSLIFLDDKKNEVDYCVFRDESFINSWDLYHATNKN